MTEWRSVKLSELGEVNRGRSRHRPRDASHLYGGRYPFIQTGDIKASNGRIVRHKQTYSEAGLAQSRLWPAGTMVITIAANIAETAILSYPACFPDSVVGFIANPEIADVRFVEYSFRLLRRQIQYENVGTGSVQDNINLQTLARLNLLVPNIVEQGAIASVLGALDEKIELNRSINLSLEAVSRAVFRDWFVNFGPIRANQNNCEAYLSKELWSCFPASFSESGLPQGWRLTTLEELIGELETGSRPKGGIARYLSGVPSIGAESITGLGEFDFSKTKYIPKDFFSAMKKGRIRDRDVLLYKDGGRPGEFEPRVTMFGNGFPFDTAAINEHVYRIRANEWVGQNYLFFLLSSPESISEMREKGTGVAIPGLNSTQLKSLTALLPTNEALLAFNSFVDPLIEMILLNCKEIRRLDELRDLLLPKLLTGEIRVKEAEKIVGAAT